MPTPNLGLSSTSQSSGSLVTFLNWRLLQDGTSGSSNMEKIDIWAGTVSGSFASKQTQIDNINVDRFFTVIGTGNGTLYSASNSEISAYTEALTIKLILDTTTSGSASLNINSMGAKNLRKRIGGASLPLQSGDLEAGVYNTFVYSSGEFVWGGAQAQHWTYLQTPLTSTSWDGDARSTTAKTLIDLSVVFGVPANIKAGLFKISVLDSGAASADAYLILSPNNTAGEGMVVPCLPSNTRENRVDIVVPCNTDGDVYYQIVATGAGTLTASIQMWGYDK